MGGPERFKTYGNVFDEFTRRNIFKLASRGFFEETLLPVSIGKEANIFAAPAEDGRMVTIKIYRLENCNFNKMRGYLQTDPRYKNMSQNRRQVIFAWVQREFRNLIKAREAGVRVPTPIHFMANIILEEFIGHGNAPAPQLNKSPVDDPQKMCKDICAQMKALYQGGIIHGDLSPFNILVHNQKPFFIDMSQSTELEDPNAEEYLQRDASNLERFFSRFGIDVDTDRILGYIREDKNLLSDEP
ncbi:MAG: serine protein kinase RIO [Nanoarchaeota archaeon]